MTAVGDARKRKAEASGLPETTAEYITRLCTENQALRAERDELNEALHNLTDDRLTNAHDELERLRRGILEMASSPHQTVDHLGNVTGYLVSATDLRALLADPQPATPATTDGYHCHTCRREERL